MASTLIASNVLNSISYRLKGDVYENDKILILLTGSTLDVDNKLLKLKSLKDKGFDLSIGFSFVAEKILDVDRVKSTLNPSKIYREEDIFNLNSISNMYSILICPNLTMSTLSKISLGTIDTFVSNIVWTFLYQGKEVYLDFNSVRHYLGMESKSKGIKELIDIYINSVLNMGAIEVSWERLDFKKENKFYKEINKNNASKDLITERDIMNLNKKILVLRSDTLITPLARDKARELGIEIQIQ